MFKQMNQIILCRRLYIVTLSVIAVIFLCSYVTNALHHDIDDISVDSLRRVYLQHPSQWPKPNISQGVQWLEIAALPVEYTWGEVDKNVKVKLGQLLFFDPRLSRSNQISCSSCHDPDLAWQDGRRVALGNNHLQGNRNTPTLLNTFLYEKLFWDGRANGYEDQALGPLSAHNEMAMEVKDLPNKIANIKGYRTLFDSAYGSPEVTLERITNAIAAFEKIIKSRSAPFDRFVRGNSNALTDDQVKGLHLFRTKARCINCHHGAYFTDNSFHNIGLSYYGRKFEDLGLYNVTKKPEDVGKFKTPSLRDVMKTGPWMHNGLFDDMTGIINIYNSGMPQKPKGAQLKDPLFPKTDSLLEPLNLSRNEIKYLVSFMEAITGVPYKMPRPPLPE